MICLGGFEHFRHEVVKVNSTRLKVANVVNCEYRVILIFYIFLCKSLHRFPHNQINCGCLGRVRDHLLQKLT